MERDRGSQRRGGGAWRLAIPAAAPMAVDRLAVGLLAFAAGDTTYNVLTTVLGQDQPFPSAADVSISRVFPADRGRAAGPCSLRRGQPRPGQPAGCHRRNAKPGFAVLAIPDRPAGVRRRLGARPGDLGRLSAVRHPASGGDRPLVTAVRWSPAVVLLALGGLGLLVADVMYGLSQLRRLLGSRRPGRPRLDRLLRVLGAGRAAPVDGRAHRPARAGRPLECARCGWRCSRSPRLSPASRWSRRAGPGAVTPACASVVPQRCSSLVLVPACTAR